MFQRFKQLSRNTDGGDHIFQVIDDDFETTVSAKYATEVETAVAKLYEERGLPVAINLVRCLVFANEHYREGMNHLTSYNKKHNPYYIKYEKDIEKYLALL